MLKQTIKILPLVLLLSACKSSLKADLFRTIDRTCGPDRQANCTIVLKDVTKFKWDKMYLFGSWTKSDSIGKSIGFNYGGTDVEDDYRRMLFTYENRVVYEEDFKSLDSYSSTLNFPRLSDSLNSGNSTYLTPRNAIFTVEKEKNSGCQGCFAYNLISIKNPSP